MKHVVKPVATARAASTCGLALLLVACGAERPPGPHDAKPAQSPLSAAFDRSYQPVEPVAVSPAAPTVTIATYNVNYGLAGEPSVEEVISGLGADLVFLQETNAAWERALTDLRSRYPFSAYRHCCHAGGLAVLSKTSISLEDYVHPEGAWFPAWRIVANTPVGRIQVVNVHLRPNVSDGGSVVSGLFTTPAIREAEIAHYIATLDASLPAVFVGDFNETADGLAIQKLNALDMRSALPEVGGSQHTWRWKTPLGYIRKQLDHVVYGNRLDVVSAKVIYAGPSDHFPVVATLRARQTRRTNLSSRK
jgi:endonuclease/exonuclease/phosphatase (EEP) superfamily protein YafD